MGLISRLKELSQLLTDSQQGYAEATERINDRYAKEMLMKIGNGRAPLIEEIGNELARSGEETPDEGTVKGSLHRIWISIKETLANSKESEIIAECERGERYLLEQYDTVLESSDLPARIEPMLHKHREKIQTDLNSIASIGKNLQEQ